ncbi:MAG: hypothetical protein KC433_09920 [Anaerolineales bacterium]|nr:hypothetical protein [Anaerolineales bacterium]
MAIEIPVLKPGIFTASADLSGKQFYFVKLSGAGTVTVCAAATDVPIGVLQNKPTSGQAAEVMMLGISKVSSDAALSRGNLIGTSGDGQADAKTPGTDTTEYVVGQVIEASTAAGGLATAAINCLNPVRAA